MLEFYAAVQSCKTGAMTRTDRLVPALAATALALRESFEDGSPQVIPARETLFETAEVFAWIQAAHPATKASTALAKIHALKRGWGLDVEPPPEDGAPDPGRPAELYVHSAVVLEPAPYLPRPGQDFHGWVSETREALGAPFGMQAPGIECACREAIDRLQLLLAPTLALTGPRSYRYNAFVGDYLRTPFGFHVDPHQEAVFQYVVEGRRTVHFWDGLTLQDRDAAWVEDANGLARPRLEPEYSFELEPGDIVFWPGTHVHGFEPAGPSMALSMVIDRHAPSPRAQVVRDLEFVTMGGTAARPPPERRPVLTPDAQLWRRSPFGIAHARWEDALIIGVCGRTFDWPEPASKSAALAAFEHLNTLAPGELVRAETLLTRCACEALPTPELLEILSVLVSLGFLGFLG